jgi:hypothetical protein
MSDNLLQPPSDPLAPQTQADELRTTGMRMLRMFFSVAAMADAAATRDPEVMLKSVPEAASFVREYYGESREAELLAEMEALEIKLIRVSDKLAS